MQSIEILLISVLLAVGQRTTSSEFPNWQSSWIAGGSDAAPGEFPYLVSVRMRDIHMCGGSILNDWYIITVAHCVFRYPASSFIVLVGTNTLNAGGKRHKVSSIIAHLHFYSPHNVNDIALLKLKQPVAFSPRLQPINPPNQDEIVALGTVCNFGGWGYTSVNGPFSNSLQKVEIMIVPSTHCQQHYLNFSDTRLCARASIRRQLCVGDSGGPLICNGKQVGIFIGGGPRNAICTNAYPLQFVYVSKYINWITENVRSFGMG